MQDDLMQDDIIQKNSLRVQGRLESLGKVDHPCWTSPGRLGFMNIVTHDNRFC